MRIAGIILIILGVVGLIYGGITYTRRRDTVSIGPITATVNQRETLPISPIAGAVATPVRSCSGSRAPRRQWPLLQD